MTLEMLAVAALVALAVWGTYASWRCWRDTRYWHRLARLYASSGAVGEPMARAMVRWMWVGSLGLLMTMAGGVMASLAPQTPGVSLVDNVAYYLVMGGSVVIFLWFAVALATRGRYASDAEVVPESR